MLIEINIDGLVGPTHHFGGLGVGNVASLEHRNEVSHPRQAALEGLQKAWLIASMGIPQFVFVPPLRPRMNLLSEMGFHGTVQEQLIAARDEAPKVLSAAFSSAFMWMANAATVTPASDSADGRMHCTPANLISSWHRASEASERTPQLEALLLAVQNKLMHRPLPSILPLRDEGAANHMRLCDHSGHNGFNLFIYGVDEDNDNVPATAKFTPRHTRAASLAIARLHQLKKARTFFLQQHPRAIDAGVFHNDVIATSCDHILLHHEFAFLDGEAELTRLESEFEKSCGQSLLRIVVSESELPIADAVRSYLFNSQLVRRNRDSGDSSTTPSYVLICPHHCEEVPNAAKLISSWIASPEVPIDEVRFVRLSESMANGGGPACLRLRMMLDPEEIASLSSKYRLTNGLFDRLSAAIEKCYPKSLSSKDFCNPDFVTELQHIDSTLQALVA